MKFLGVLFAALVIIMMSASNTVEAQAKHRIVTSGGTGMEDRTGWSIKSGGTTCKPFV